MRGQLLAWYDQNRREMPWRRDNPDPYHVWLSEIMLQQTTVAAVIPYFLKFIQKWPRIENLAAAPREDIMAAWAGLGYYARARNLHKCAQVIVTDYNSSFPETEKDLLKLPGIGPYTAGAIRSIAFNQPADVIDGNLERIAARIFAVQDPLPASKPVLKNAASRLYDGHSERPGDLAQAWMDLGATVCIPKAPRCGLCPVQSHCLAKSSGIAAQLPRRSRRAKKPLRKGKAFWIEDNAGRILLHSRADNIMLGGMIGLPTTNWHDKSSASADMGDLDIHILSGDYPDVIHSFTHFDLHLELRCAALLSQNIPDHYEWHNVDSLSLNSMPSLFQKALKMFLKG